MVRQFKLHQELQDIEDMKQYYLSEIEQNRQELKELVTNKKTLEKFARERYLMKRENEDIYLVIEK
jgi:hypothetical protein